MILESMKEANINNTLTPTGNEIISVIKPIASSSPYNSIKIDLTAYLTLNGRTKD